MITLTMLNHGLTNKNLRFTKKRLWYQQQENSFVLLVSFQPGKRKCNRQWTPSNTHVVTSPTHIWQLQFRYIVRGVEMSRNSKHLSSIIQSHYITLSRHFPKSPETYGGGICGQLLPDLKFFVLDEKRISSTKISLLRWNGTSNTYFEVILCNWGARSTRE